MLITIFHSFIENVSAGTEDLSRFVRERWNLGPRNPIATSHLCQPRNVRHLYRQPRIDSSITNSTRFLDSFQSMPEFPAHASPALNPAAQSNGLKAHNRNVSDLNLQGSKPTTFSGSALTPPDTPFTHIQNHDREAKSDSELVPDSHADDLPPALLEQLPEVRCEVRARIPTTNGTEMFLHLYHNTLDKKEHLAIVFGPNIRSKSLDAPRAGESERDRMIRGAYTGVLYPGRTHSRVQQIRKEAGASLRPSAGYLSALNESPSSSSLPSEHSSSDGEPPSSLYPTELDPPLVRIHSECYTGETVWSARCDCGEQLDEAARLMSLPAPTSESTTPNEEASKGRTSTAGGVIVYLRQEGRGIGLLSKLKAYNLQDLGHDTMEANVLLRHPGDARSYGIATAILLDLDLGGDRGIRLLTNNPEKVRAVEGPNKEVRVVQRVPMIPLAWKTAGKEGVRGPEVEKYISTKIEKFKHMFSES